MQTHTVVTRMVTDTVRAELTYENYPVIAGTEELSLVLKFRYIGEINSSKKAALPKENLDGTENGSASSNGYKDDENGGWFGRKISSQFSNATRALFLQQLETLSEEQDESEQSQLNSGKLKDINIFLGYTQILGSYVINPSIIDKKIFEDLRKSTIFADKIAGITGLEIDLQQQKGGILHDLSHLFNADLNSLDKMNENSTKSLIPIYSTTQSLLFSDLTFKPSQYTNSSTSADLSKSFYVSLRLPKELPPSYESESIVITYNFILGYQQEINGQLINKTIFFPLKIQPFIDLHARQPIYHLEAVKLNQQPKFIKNVDVNSNFDQVPKSLSKRFSNKQLKRQHSDASLQLDNNNSNTSRRSSMDTQAFSKTIPSSDDKEKLSTFVEFVSELNKTDSSNILKLQEDFENSFYDPTHFVTVRENLINIFAGVKDTTDMKLVYESQKDKITHGDGYDNSGDDVNGEDGDDDDYEDDIEYESLLPKRPQTKFVLKQNHLNIASVNINRAIFKVGDTISLNISFNDRQLLTTGLEIKLIKDEVIYREEYICKNEYGDPASLVSNNNHLESTIYHKVVSTMCDEEVNASLIIPKSATPHFKTNFFYVNYIVQIKFIMIDAYDNLKKMRQKEKESQSALVAVSTVESNVTENGLARNSIDGTTLTSETIEETLNERKVYELDSIYHDNKGQILYRGVEYIQDGMEFIVRLPVIILPNYEQDFGSNL